MGFLPLQLLRARAIEHKKNPFFRANSAKKGIVSGLQQSSRYANLYSALDIKKMFYI